ncbi:uncharacterized protein FA14DRAFT_161249 [Meira miltonrushii]|uniref:CP-type G domain-containing protein n=1 Tax=Meira miltonrushii TaxID=1280837 RepID=A0A316VCS5_9BASI|nr:uncharacterized protein FA14DRAFT_161249 [Meira miltonrushii]PWN33355.1 hypothetical protein FA14DRAFT_161249 [Meira miltonrushii]
MGRNKNKNNRSVARSRAGLQAGGGKVGNNNNKAGLKKDTGLPAFFKQRKQLFAQNGSSPLENFSATSDAMETAENDIRDLIAPKDGFERASRDLALSGKRDNSAKAFMRDVKQVIENSDVILQVLDARDPLGSRSKQTEQMALAHGKRVVLVLNKVDLIPLANMQSWLRYLRNDFPTLAFKASTQQQRGNLKQGRGSVDVGSKNAKNAGESSNEKLSHGSEAIGANALLQLLKNYARTTAKGSNLKQQINVGVVGPPNVGKSSLINSLLRTRACAVASTPGWTKVVQGVMLEKGIRLLDCPGVVLGGAGFEQMADVANGDGTATKDEVAWSVLRNTVKVELIDDPIAPIQAMLGRVDAEQLSTLYNIEGGFNEGDAHDFLLRVALMRGKLGKGGIPDLEGAARIVLHDWNIGKISFYSTPPAVHHSLQKPGQEAGQAAEATNTDAGNANGAGDGLVAGSSLVTGFSDAFDLAALLGEADAEAMGVRKDDDFKTAGRGKDLIVARDRVYASDKAAVEPEAIIEDEEQIEAATALQADTSRSSLGKRRRGMDEMDSSDEEEEDEQSNLSDDDMIAGTDRQSRPSRRRPSLSVMFDQSGIPNTDEDERRGRSPISRDVMTDGTGAKREPVLSRQQRELQRALGEHEVAGMARKRGDVRKAAKKSQKRLKKSGAGLVDVWNSSMALGSQGGDVIDEDVDIDEDNDNASPKNKGLFELLESRDQGPAQQEEEEEEL